MTNPPRDPMTPGVHLDRAAEILAAVEAADNFGPVMLNNYRFQLAQAHAAIAHARATITLAGRVGA